MHLKLISERKDFQGNSKITPDLFSIEKLDLFKYLLGLRDIINSLNYQAT